MILNRNAQVQVWLAPVPIQSRVGAIANRGQWEQGCIVYLWPQTWVQLGPHIKKKKLICPDFRSHLKTWPFAIRPSFDHFKSKIVGISHTHFVDVF